MLVVKLSGGLGNQMFQYAVGVSLATHYGVELRFDTSNYHGGYNRRLEIENLNVDIKKANKIDYIKTQGYLSYINRALNKMGLSFNTSKFKYKLEKENPFFQGELFTDLNSAYLEGYWQNEKYFVSNRESLLNEFTLKHEAGKQYDLYLNQIRNEQSVALHVRRGDYVLDSGMLGNHGLCSLEYYNRSIRLMRERYGDVKFFVFSDDLEWAKNNLDTPQSSVFVEGTSSAVEDMLLMKYCKHNIISNSTFSWWSAWLNEYEDKLVICPNFWWGGNRKAHIAPESWLRLEV